MCNTGIGIVFYVSKYDLKGEKLSEMRFRMEMDPWKLRNDDI